jgi:integrase
VRDYAKEIEPGLSPSSVKRMVSNVGVLTGKIAGNGNHTSSILVAAEMKRQRRKKGSAHKQALAIRQKGDVMDLGGGAQPFSIERMIEVLEPDKSLWAARAKLLLSLGGDTGRRGGEYRAAKMGDLRPINDGADGGIFLIRQSKTDQDGVGLVKFASRRTMRFADEYRRILKAHGGDVGPYAPLFVPVDRWANPNTTRGEEGESLTTKGLIMVLRKIVEKALTIMADEIGDATDDIATIVRGVSGHSFRVGLAMDLVTAGESIVAICVEGGWATPAMPVYYTRFISARTGAAARLAARLGYG